MFRKAGGLRSSRTAVEVLAMRRIGMGPEDGGYGNYMEREPIGGEERIQTELLKKQLFYSRLTCIAVVVFLVIFTAALLPKSVKVLNTLEEITSELNEVDFGGLAEDTEENLEKINESLEVLNLEALNNAIENLDQVVDTLSQAVKPLTNLYERFGR